MESAPSPFAEVATTFSLLTRNPTKFLSKDGQHADDFRLLSKTLFDFVRTSGESVPHSTDLSELLITRDFDEEQVWQQLELDNRLNVDAAVKQVAGVLVEGESEFFSSVEENPSSLGPDHHPSNLTDSDRHDADLSEPEDDTRLSKKGKTLFGNTIDNESEMDEDDDDLADDDFFGENEEKSDLDVDEDGEDEIDPESTKKRKSHSGRPKSVLDDDFFKLDEMNDFLLAEEKKSEREAEKASLDLFAGVDNEDEEGAEYRYADFYEAPAPKQTEPLIFDSEDAEKSTFEKRQEKLQHKIAELEEESLNPKSWQLSGEVSAIKRPENSLLEEFLQFDHVTRQAPAITEEVTQKLEDLILQRIKDKVFDDVERKVKPKDVDPYEYKKKQILDEGKSKQTLSQIYEQEYLKKITPPEQTVEKEEHRKILAAMNELFVKLDALSNFHFVPKPVAPDIRIINNLPTLVVEEVQPSAVSSSQLLTPEEVLRKPREELRGSTETSATDRKRARRKKKALQHVKAVKKSRQEEGDAGKERVDKKKKMGAGASSSSATFFGKLQDTVRMEKSAEKIKDGKKRKKGAVETVVSMKKFKL